MFSKKQRFSPYKISIDDLSPFFYAKLTLKNLNTMFTTFLVTIPVFTSIIFYSCHNALVLGFKCFINV